MNIFKFEKENNGRWYVVLPDWTGSKEDLEMVRGADTMLDIIAQGDFEVYVTISEKEFTSSKFMLSYIQDREGGADYLLTSDLYQFEVWLCEVTKFVFGYLPKRLYIA